MAWRIETCIFAYFALTKNKNKGTGKKNAKLSTINADNLSVPKASSPYLL